MCWTNGEPREEKPAAACHVYFPVPHTAVVIAQPDIRTTPPIITIFWESSEREEKNLRQNEI